ncbi:hypothetical protein [Paraburkholderia sp. CNPSo 3281]|uniref:hypothetical protein n=1 Tax=Paraburkholderia sp. CNPSo 3281 TaxID=2940933 RepID=UPI0020B82F9E|nr:hypothetical protein [Paraburkholderia sp. CNPSo 3281]MCP3721323.1 hypothetical protein [Paraburkholderia sp. CNPSo 3281]
MRVAINGGGATGVELRAELRNAAMQLRQYDLDGFDEGRLTVTSMGQWKSSPFAIHLSQLIAGFPKGPNLSASPTGNGFRSWRGGAVKVRALACRYFAGALRHGASLPCRSLRKSDFRFALPVLPTHAFHETYALLIKCNFSLLETRNQLKVKLFNERLDDPDRIVVSDEVIKAFWKQRHLLAIFTFYESLHPVTHAERVNPV